MNNISRSRRLAPTLRVRSGQVDGTRSSRRRRTFIAPPAGAQLCVAVRNSTIRDREATSGTAAGFFLRSKTTTQSVSRNGRSASAHVCKYFNTLSLRKWHDGAGISIDGMFPVALADCGDGLQLCKHATYALSTLYNTV